MLCRILYITFWRYPGHVNKETLVTLMLSIQTQEVIFIIGPEQTWKDRQAFLVMFPFPAPW